MARAPQSYRAGMLGESQADVCIAALDGDPNLVISAGTVAEAPIVAARRNVGNEVARLIDGLGMETGEQYRVFQADHCLR